MGGLVGAVTALLFLVKSYTDSSLEVTIGIDLFQTPNEQPDQVGKQIHIFTFFSYVRLTLYRMLKLFGWNGKWTLPQRLENFQQEALKQLDVQILLKRLIKLQTCMTHLLTPLELQKIREEENINIKTAKTMRLLLLKSQDKEQQENIENESVIQDLPKKELYILRISDAIENMDSEISMNHQRQTFRAETVKSNQASNCKHPSLTKKECKKESNILLEPMKFTGRDFFQGEIPLFKK